MQGESDLQIIALGVLRHGNDGTDEAPDLRAFEGPTPPRPWTARLRADLDAVVAKAMQPKRDQRYDTVADLATDIERFLAHEPVHAREVGAVLPSRSRDSPAGLRCSAQPRLAHAEPARHHPAPATAARGGRGTLRAGVRGYSRPTRGLPAAGNAPGIATASRSPTRRPLLAVKKRRSIPSICMPRSNALRRSVHARRGSSSCATSASRQRPSVAIGLRRGSVCSTVSNRKPSDSARMAQSEGGRPLGDLSPGGTPTGFRRRKSVPKRYPRLMSSRPVPCRLRLQPRTQPRSSSSETKMAGPIDRM